MKHQFYFTDAGSCSKDLRQDFANTQTEFLWFTIYSRISTVKPRHNANTIPVDAQFIAIEGIEGSGKSTNLPYIVELLQQAGKAVVVTREPGGTRIGESLRGLLLDPEQTMELDTELLLMFAARAEHLVKVIRPALRGGQWVVCSRFTDATYAYQGAGRGIPNARIATLADWVQGKFSPDLTLILDIPVAEGLARVRERGPADRFEQEKMAFFQRVRMAYLARAKAHPDHYRVIDAQGSLDTVRARIGDVIQEFIRAWEGATKIGKA